MLQETYDNLWDILYEEDASEEIEELLNDIEALQRNSNVQARSNELLQQDEERGTEFEL